MISPSSIGPGPPSRTSISMSATFAECLDDITANGLMSQALTFHPWRAANSDNAPLPQPISRHLFPRPAPSLIMALASKSVSSLGGYTVGGMVSVNDSPFGACQIIDFIGRFNRSISCTALEKSKGPSSAMLVRGSHRTKPLCL